MKSTLPKVVLHGECMIFESSIPPTANVKNMLGLKVLVLVDSETTGNHHVLDVTDGVTIYESGDRMFMASTVETSIRCVHANRHDTISLSPGTYEFGTQIEYDPFTARLKRVQD